MKAPPSESRGVVLAHDGYRLAVTRFAAREPRAAMVVASAMGVRQEFYAPIARFFAGHGIEVLTFDYRGTFASRQGPLRGFHADVMTWAMQDLDAVLLEATRWGPRLRGDDSKGGDDKGRPREGGGPIYFLGHSLGGQLLGVLPHNGLVEAAITVTAGSGWYRFNDRMPLQVRLFWFGAIPLLTPLFGHFPGRALRMVGDLPAGVALQWRRWALHPDYIHSAGAHVAESFARVRAPVAGWSFEDDPIVTRPAIDDLHRRYVNAAVQRHHVEPREVGRKAIGHFGFFAESSRDTLWSGALEALSVRQPIQAAPPLRGAAQTA